MQLLKLKLHNFRNYEQLEFVPAESHNFFIGPNGAGKTNLMEAIFAFCSGKAFRTRKEEEVIRWGSTGSVAAASFAIQGANWELAIAWNHEAEISTKSFRLNQQVCKRSLEFIGIASGVLFTPKDLNLIQGEPLLRRKFLESLIFQIQPLHWDNVLRYKRCLLERNRLLKEEKWELLEPLTRQCAEYGAKIIARRLRIVEKLKPLFAHYYHHLSSSFDTVNMLYLPSFKLTQPEELPANLLQVLEKNLPQEKELKYTVSGPHKDDLFLTLRGKPMRTFASQGECRSAALALKLSSAALIKELKSDFPLVLLDDCLSELDKQRQMKLWENLQHLGQSFISSSVMPPAYLPLAQTRVFQVEKGTLAPYAL